MKKSNTHIFFWGGYLGNFHPCTIHYLDKEWHCSEQLFMYFKAMFFKDIESMRLIAECNNAKTAKKLGRKVKGFDQEKWDGVCEYYMELALELKFSQNADLKEKFLATGDLMFVEASPFDTKWGIGMGEDDPKIFDKKNWKGDNLLGKCLNNVRKKLRENDARRNNSGSE